MTNYTITADGRTHLSDRDAYAVTVRVECDGTSLGLWQTWISGMADMEIDSQSRPSITDLQRRRIAAEMLAEALEAEARSGRLRDAWQLEITVLEPTTAQTVVDYWARSSRPVPDFREGDLIRIFDL